MKTKADLDTIRAAVPKRERRLMEGDGVVSLRAAAADGAPRIGMRIPFNKRSEVLWGFVEIIDPAAFTKTLQERGGDVVCLWNHDSGIVLGRQSNNTFAVRASQDALEGEVTLDPEDTWHRNAARRVERRDVIGSSFGFETVRDRWELLEDDTVLRTLLEVRLYEISPVTFPAYPDSDAERRALGEARAVELVAATHGIDPLEVVRVLAAVEDGRIAERHAPSVRTWIAKFEQLLAPAPTTAPAGAPLELRQRRLDHLAKKHGLVTA